jgi:hypothetical protein
MYYNKPPDRHVVDREFLASFDVFHYPTTYFRLEETEYEKLNDLYSSPVIVRVIKSKRISLGGGELWQVWGEKRNAYRVRVLKGGGAFK